MANKVFEIKPGGSLSGTFRVPGDKSISHRAIMLGALASGKVTVTGFLQGEDSLATLKAFQAMGVPIKRLQETRVIIEGRGLNGLQKPDHPLDLGNSGTSMRLLAGLLAGQAFDTELVGDASLMSRPMKRVTDPLRQMGAHIEATEAGTAPLRIRGGQNLRGIDYRCPMASAQVKSCLLLAGLYASGRTCVFEPAVTRDHTERMLANLQYPVETARLRACLQGGGSLKPGEIRVPADLSSAAFFMVGASIAPGSNITLTDVGVNPTRIGVIHLLRRMGADITVFNERSFGGEPVADIQVVYSDLHGIEISPDEVSLAIDEFPVLFIAAACARGETVLEGAAELKVKESDRIGAMAEGLRRMGIDARDSASGICIKGGVFKGGRVKSHHDHRVAMSFAMAGLVSRGEIRIDHCENVNTSFPGFVELAARAGLAIESHVA